MNSPTITAAIEPPSSASANRRQPLLRTKTASAPAIEGQHRRAGEVAGRTAAEVATVCCCIPCAVMHFLVLAVYKVPTGLCRKMWRKNKQKKLLNNNTKKKKTKKNGGENGGEVEDHGGDGGGVKPEAAELETEMWGRFYGGGFWRSTSQKKGN